MLFSFISYYFLKQSLHLLILEWIANHKNLTVFIDNEGMKQLVIWYLWIYFKENVTGVKTNHTLNMRIIELF